MQLYKYIAIRSTLSTNNTSCYLVSKLFTTYSGQIPLSAIVLFGEAIDNLNEIPTVRRFDLYISESDNFISPVRPITISSGWNQ